MDDDSVTKSENEAQVYMPKWPYNRWKTDVSMSDLKSESENNPTKHKIFDKCNDFIKDNGLSLFLKQFDQELQLKEDPLNQKVEEEINEMMKQVTEELNTNDPLFNTCRLIKAGSVAEGTKVKEMNEFDFLLVVDTFQKHDFFKIKIFRTDVVIFVENKSDSKAFLERYPELYYNSELISAITDEEKPNENDVMKQNNVKNDERPDVVESKVCEKSLGDSLTGSKMNMDTESKEILEEDENNDQRMSAEESIQKLYVESERVHRTVGDEIGLNEDMEEETSVESESTCIPEDEVHKNGKRRCGESIRKHSEINNRTAARRIDMNKESFDHVKEDSLEDDKSGLQTHSDQSDQPHTIPSNEEMGFNQNSNNDYVEVITLNNVRKSFLDSFLKCLKQKIPKGWKLLKVERPFVDDCEAVCMSDIALTLHLCSEKYNREVDIDVCLCIPLTHEDIVQARIEENQDNRNTSHFYSFMEAFKATYKDVEVFAIMGENSQRGMMVGIPAVSTRITAPWLEQSIFRRYGPQSGRVKTYRYAKCIASSFLPKTTSYCGCKRCCHGIVKSYHLKNIVLFMMNNHKDDSYWTDENVPNRTVEVFDILCACIPDDRESLVGSVSTFCTPGVVRLDCISTYNQFMKVRGERSEFLYTQDSHHPTHELSFCPHYKASLHCGIEVVDAAVKAYFHFLNNEHWDSYELIFKISKLLHDLSKLEISNGGAFNKSSCATVS